MERRNLKKGAALWKQGTRAGSIGVVEDGLFGVMVDGHLTGIAWKGLVIGEGALKGRPGSAVSRTASVFALTDGAQIREIEVHELHGAFEAGDRFLVGPILVTLVGQIVRNCLLLVEALPNDKVVSRPMTAMMEATVEAFRDRPDVSSWDELIRRIGILVSARDYTDRLRAELGVDGADRSAVRCASDRVREMFKDHESVADLIALIDAEKQKADVMQSAAGDRELAFLIRN